MDEASRFARIKALFLDVCELPEPARRAYLDASGADPGLIEHVQCLLDAETDDAQPLVAPVLGLLTEIVSTESLAAGARLGAWTLSRKIGEGGMGSVYQAQRSDGHFEQTAAIKVLRGVPTPAALEFLARERQILASLAHPNIARLLDGGATPQGQPYLVMEYLDGGMPINRYCREQQLPVADILGLLIKVCAAVSFAHSRLVVHCDLKPSNILVDPEGRPWLLDFGIARLLSERADASAAVIPAGRPIRAFTPGYASPEQEQGDAVSTLSDVYSLGHLLRALLQDSAAAGDAELLAVIARSTQIEPMARYASVAAFSTDLARYLVREPLQAMPNRLGYRTRKLLQRRWPAISVAAAFVLTISAFTLQLAADRDRALAAERRAIEERDRATQAELSSRQISQFLGNILSSVDPDNAKSMDRTLMRTLLDQAAVRAREELADNPLVLRQVETVVADSYSAISDFAAAIEHYDAALRTFAAESDQAPLPATERISQLQLGYRKVIALIDGGQAVLAGQLLPELIARAEQQLGPSAELTLRLQSRRAQQLFRIGDLKSALQTARNTQQLFESSGLQAPEAWLYQLNILGILESNHRQYGEAQSLMQRAIDLATATYGALHSTTLRARHSLAVLLLQSRRRAAAVELLKPLLLDTEHALGPGHVLTISTLSNLGTALRLNGSLAESSTYYQLAHERALQRFGHAHPLTLDLANNLALYEIAAGQSEVALQRIEGVIVQAQQIHSRTHPAMVEALRTRARALSALQRSEAARAAWAEVIHRDQELYGPHDAQTLTDQRELEMLSK